MKSYDIIIIGGGVVGTAIAREFSRYKFSIALLEKEAELAFGVSKSNSGIIHPGTQINANLLKGKLCVQGNILIRELARDLGVDFKEVGELIVAFDEPERSRLYELKSEAEILGVPGLEIVRQDWLRIKEPNLSKDVIAALYAPTAGIISPYRLVYDLSENAKKNGVDFFTNSKVINIEKENNGFIVNIGTGSFKSKYVINAAGLYADDIAIMVGIDDINIRPRKGEEFLLDKKLHNITNHLIFPLPTKTSKGIIVIKTSDGNPMIGPTAEDVEDKEDVGTTEAGFNNVLNGVKKMVPTIKENDVIAYFAGLRPVAGDDFIIRYEKTVPGFVNVAGIQSPGLTAAPAIAVMVINILKENGMVLQKKQKFINERKKTLHLFSLPMPEAKQIIENDEAYGDIVCRCEMVSAKEIREAINRGATTLDGIKFRTRAQAGRCHGGFCTTRLMKILAEETSQLFTEVNKRGKGSEIIKEDRADERT
ncbi:MAG: NAD(P)/FAD-dependent oxidoreductase [Candidatus Omnitrophota bacterium]